MNIENIKNVVGGDVKNIGNVIIGDNGIIINLKEAAEYKSLQDELKELNKQFGETEVRIHKYQDDESFKKELWDISKKQNEVIKKIDLLKREVLRLADDFSKMPINTERLRLAKQYFEAGAFDKARAVLDVEAMNNELSALKQEEQKLKERIDQNKQRLDETGNEFLILARLTAIDFALPGRVKKAKEYFEQSISASPNFSNVFDCAAFLSENNQFKDAYELIPQLEKLGADNDKGTPSQFDTDKIKVLNLKGELEESQGKNLEAFKTYLKALELSKKAITRSGVESKFFLITIINNISSLCFKLNYYEEAQPYINESFEIYKTIKKPTIEIKAAFGNATKIAALIYYKIGKLNKNGHVPGSFGFDITKASTYSRTFFRDSIKVYKEISDINPIKYLVEYINCLSEEAKLILEEEEITQESLVEIEGIYRDAIDICREQSKNNPELYLPPLGECLSMYCGYLGRMVSAVTDVYKNRANISAELVDGINKVRAELKNTGEEALQIGERLYNDNPKTFLPYLIKKQYGLANVYLVLDDKEKAKGYLQNAFDNYRILKEQTPEICFEEYFDHLEYLAFTYFEQKKFDEAEKVFELLNDDFAALLLNKRMEYYPKLVGNLTTLTTIFKDDMPDKEKSLGYANEALELITVFEKTTGRKESFKNTRQKLMEIISYWEKKNGLFSKLKRLIS